MYTPSVVRPLRAVIVGCLAAAPLICGGVAGAAGAKCEDNWGAQPRNVGPGSNILQGVAATGGCTAWAVGSYDSRAGTQTLIERWSGRAWSIEPSANPGGATGEDELNGVSAVSPTDVWAVGNYSNGTADQTLIEHWNGKTWRVQSSPDPGGSGDDTELNAVTAVSPTDAWAVGFDYNGTADQTLIEHWNGKTWTAQPSPSIAGSRKGNHRRFSTRPTVSLTGVVAVSSGNAWAVGYHSTRTGSRPLIEHWNGKQWKIQRGVNPGGASGATLLSSVTATSAANAWAVGYYDTSFSNPGLTFVEHWNGTSWRAQPSPNPGGTTSSELYGVAATSPSRAWAIGDYGAKAARPDPGFVEAWSGKVWRTRPSLNPSGASELNGVAAGSPNNVWAVGYYYNGRADRAFALYGG